jgi:hypothetical protein
MYTFGGMLVTNAEKRRLEGGCNEFYYRTTDEAPPLKITVPRLTRKERLELDQGLPTKRLKIAANFGINEDELAAYCEFHRYFPLYSELV